MRQTKLGAIDALQTRVVRTTGWILSCAAVLVIVTVVLAVGSLYRAITEESERSSMRALDAEVHGVQMTVLQERRENRATADRDASTFVLFLGRYLENQNHRVLSTTSDGPNFTLELEVWTEEEAEFHFGPILVTCLRVTSTSSTVKTSGMPCSVDTSHDGRLVTTITPLTDAVAVPAPSPSLRRRATAALDGATNEMCALSAPGAGERALTESAKRGQQREMEWPSAADQDSIWPVSVPLRQVRGVYTTNTITVYQAYPAEIAEPALSAGRFVAPFKRSRMTWIKPSFLWMMYRCGWGEKPDQERVLAVEITRDGFEWALTNASLSHFDRDQHPDQATWARLLKSSPARVQWDPERSLHLQPLAHRSLQLGLQGEAVDRYVDDWTVTVTDVTPLDDKFQGRSVVVGHE